MPAQEKIEEKAAAEHGERYYVDRLPESNNALKVIFIYPNICAESLGKHIDSKKHFTRLINEELKFSDNSVNFDESKLIRFDIHLPWE